MKAVILAAGKGTRMEPLSCTTPKLLIPIFNRPLLDHFVNILNKFIDEIILVVSEPGHAKIIKAYIKNQNFPIKISFVYQKKILGTGIAVQYAKSKIKRSEKFFILNGDDIYSKKDIKKMLKYPFAIIGKKVTDPEKWGILKKDRYYNLIKITEKPKEYVGNLANTGGFLLDYQVFDLFKQIKKSPRGEYELTDIITLIAQKNPIKIINGEWFPIGFPWHILTAHKQLIQKQNFFNEGEIDETVEINGKIKLGRNSEIGRDVKIKGNLIIGDNTIIEDGVRIDGPVVIGDNCKIGKLSCLKNCVIMNNCKLKGLNLLCDGILGKNTKWGFNTIAINSYGENKTVLVTIKGKKENSGLAKLSCIIGDNVEVGTKCIFYPGVKVKPNKTIRNNLIVTEDFE